MRGSHIPAATHSTRRRKDRRHEQKSLFRVLVTTLVITDLVGTCAVTNKTMLAMGHGLNDTAVCKYFGFSMTFFSLATMSILFAMALERYFSIGYPYLYERHFGRRCGYISVRVYMDSLGRKGEDHRIDLIALRFLSINPIINPWVFIILGPSRLRFLRGALCRARKASSHPQKDTHAHLELCHGSAPHGPEQTRLGGLTNSDMKQEVPT
ncbi:hypothetical protein JZ751_010412 [Albula glossodonta]|uniref:G-protein coupled receptors family 1 profile domain-containing protein n=1 Tax=Albula glossodonta TaxID=121402 RepID=A0A8T2NWJ0_9TELE|nr:hypothetical protein JZ751_010412 [Albula glossodonta]